MDYIKKIVTEFEGKEIWFCETSGTNGQRINLNPDNISFCHEHEIVKPTELIISNLNSFSVEKYYEAVYRVLKKMQSDDFPCRKCSHCKKKKFFFQPIGGLVTINTSMYCDNSCIYCIGHFGCEGEGYDPLPMLKPFVEQGLFGKEVLFDWGGGEPTKNIFYEDAVEYLSEQGYKQRFNTNAIDFSPNTYNALKNGRGMARISVDSGSKSGYLLVKGTDNYERVWENIERYCGISNNVFIKYNICNYNSDIEEIDEFLLNCTKRRVKNIIISAEARSYQPIKNAGPFYYREQELKAAKYMEQIAKDKGLNVIISEYPYESRGEYVDGKLVLPEKYFDNIDREIITNNIYLKTFANMELFLKYIENAKRKVLIFGAGEIGRNLGEIFKFCGIAYSYIDNNEKLENVNIDGNICLSAKSIMKKRPKAQIVLTSNKWKSMLKQINFANYDLNDYLYWMSPLHYRDFLLRCIREKN